MPFVIALVGALLLYGLLPLPWWAYIPANLLLAAVLVVVARRRGHTLDELGMDRASLLRGAGIGLIAAGIVLGVVGVVAQLAALDPQAAGLLASQRDVGPFGLAFEVLVRIPLGTVLLEAVAFRGVLFAAVQRVRSTVAAVIVTSLTFGLWHVGPTLRELRELGTLVDPVTTVVGIVVVTALGGLLFALLRLAGRSLVTSALTHWSMNAAGLVAAAVVAAG